MVHAGEGGAILGGHGGNLEARHEAAAAAARAGGGEGQQAGSAAADAAAEGRKEVVVGSHVVWCGPALVMQAPRAGAPYWVSVATIALAKSSIAPAYCNVGSPFFADMQSCVPDVLKECVVGWGVGVRKRRCKGAAKQASAGSGCPQRQPVHRECSSAVHEAGCIAEGAVRARGRLGRARKVLLISRPGPCSLSHPSEAGPRWCLPAPSIRGCRCREPRGSKGAAQAAWAEGRWRRAAARPSSARRVKAWPGPRMWRDAWA